MVSVKVFHRRLSILSLLWEDNCSNYCQYNSSIIDGRRKLKKLIKLALKFDPLVFLLL